MKAGRSDIHADEAPTLRVIAVGRTGIEPVLRLEPGTELVRARTGLDAIGELSEPAPEGVETVVLVGAGAHGTADAPTGGDDASLATALRRVDPCARILRAAGIHDPCDLAPFDGVVHPDEPLEELRRALRAARPRAPVDTGPEDRERPVEEARQVSEPAAQEPAHPMHAPMPEVKPPPAAEAVGDEGLVRLLMRGEEILPEALRVISARTGAPAVFCEAGQAPGAARVEWRGLTRGWLSAEGHTAADLAPHAAWLAAWLTVRDQHAQLNEAAFTDPLTGAWNRRYFERFLGAAIEQARAARGVVTLLFFDLDDFKRFNDDHGHEAGDEILRQTVALLRSVIRPGDRVCRIGGDEFAVVFHQPEGPRDPASRPPESVCAIAARFQEQVRRQRFPKLGMHAPGALTISGGLATYPWDGRSAEELLRHADALALECKRQGKNAIIYGPGAAGA